MSLSEGGEVNVLSITEMVIDPKSVIAKIQPFYFTMNSCFV